MVIVVLGLVKLPVAALMLWIPFRDDRAMMAARDVAKGDEPGDAEDDGGSKALPASPLDPHPRTPHPRPRWRGPHGSNPPPPSSRRMRSRLGLTQPRPRSLPRSAQAQRSRLR